MATCTVSFNVVDPSETGIEGAEIQANISEPVETGSNSQVFPKRLNATTDSNGDTTLNLIQGLDAQIRIISNNGNSGSVEKTYNITVPASGTANFNDLV